MSDLIAESRPLPAPFTTTSTEIGPPFRSFSASAATIFEAANGVAFLGPLKPREPAVAQARTLPERSGCCCPCRPRPPVLAPRGGRARRPPALYAPPLLAPRPP